MAAPSCTREQFIEIWNRLGSPTLVSDELGNYDLMEVSLNYLRRRYS